MAGILLMHHYVPLSSLSTSRSSQDVLAAGVCWFWMPVSLANWIGYAEIIAGPNDSCQLLLVFRRNLGVSRCMFFISPDLIRSPRRTHQHTLGLLGSSPFSTNYVGSLGIPLTMRLFVFLKKEYVEGDSWLFLLPILRFQRDSQYQWRRQNVFLDIHGYVDANSFDC